ncbi:MAG: GNAT family N-acetyltransferase [Microgenomates group bacterium]
MEHIQIRSLEQNDVQELLSFMNALSKEQTYIRLQGEELTMDEEIRYIDDFIRRVREKKAIKLLAFNGKELVGVADVYLKDKIENHIGVFGITIKKEWRGKGIGRKLMEQTLREAATSIDGLKIIELGVFANNPVAKKMYEKMGFVEYGKLPKGIRHKGEFVDHLYMYKEV